MERLIGNKDTRLYTVTYPNSGKDTIIMLHGGPGVPDGLDPVISYLHRHFQVISFHQRGTLNSPCYSGNYSLERYISDIDQLATYFELPKFHLFGHSWGGLYAQIYAEQSMDRLQSMFLCSPGSGTGKQWREMGMEVAKYNKDKSTKQEWFSMLRHAMQGFLGSDKAYEKLFTQFCLNCNKGYLVDDPIPVQVDHIVAQPINRTNWAILLYHQLEKMTNPGFKVTVSYGDNDIFGDSTRYVKDRYPTAEFITIPGSSHFPWLQNEAAFYNALSAHYGITNPVPSEPSHRTF
ncbi:alpha/beta fold hydrolase [Pontibacter ruber]|uniref:Alpha/beta fold hydrolase n=1 Tax=Pontibacter ruber TaxID=1343895 RepID=A0ABW5D1F3_9BACT|nr:alpha/beta hydrolase [Pontibacter ruber]